LEKENRMTIRLHHLEYSRSTRILWLLEELGEAYQMVRYARDPVTRRSPAELAAVHPLSKAPAVEVDGRTMVESGAIIEYLIATRGNGRLAPAADSADYAAYLEWLHFAEGTVAMPMILSAIAPAFGGLGDRLGGFVAGEVKKLLDYAESHMAGQHAKGSHYLVGDDLTGADINFEYLLQHARNLGELDTRPALSAYVTRLEARPAYVKAIELGGPVTFARR
jgi:glutathione S-transferase